MKVQIHRNENRTDAQIPVHKCPWQCFHNSQEVERTQITINQGVGTQNGDKDIKQDIIQP